MKLYAEDIITMLEAIDYEPRKRIYVLDGDTDEYKTIDDIRVDSEGDIVIDVSQ